MGGTGAGPVVGVGGGWEEVESRCSRCSNFSRACLHLMRVGRGTLRRRRYCSKQGFVQVGGGGSGNSPQDSHLYMYMYIELQE